MKTLSNTSSMAHITESTEIKKQESIFPELIGFLENYRSPNHPILVSIILPMYNEEKVIRSVLESLPDHELIEIIVINDHSTDNSLEEIKKVKSPRNIRVINHKRNKGYGGAICTGMKNAEGKVVVSMDSDGQHVVNDILNLIKPIFEGKADMTIGSRYLGTYNYELPLLRQAGEILAEKVIRIFFRLKIKNNQNGFRAFDKKVAKVFKAIYYLDYAFCTEQILKAKVYGYVIKECPITVLGRQHGASKLTIIRLALNIFSCLLIYYIKKIKVNLAKKSKFLSILF